MKSHRRDADAEEFMYLTIAEFVDPVHQKHPACLWRHGVDRLFIEPEKVVGFHIPFLLRRAGGVAFLLKGKEKRSAERRVGKECVSTRRSRGAPYHLITHPTIRKNTTSQEYITK